MNIVGLQILFYLSLIIWLFPPLRHYKKKFFYFFLILALADPFALIYRAIFLKPAPQLYNYLLSYALILSLLEFRTIIKHKYFFLIVLLLLFIISFPYNFIFQIDSSLYLSLNFMQTMNFYLSVFLLSQIIIFIILLKLSIVKYVSTTKFNVFYFVLVFYQLTVVLKFFNFLVGFADAGAFFVITTIAQNIFGLFFSIVREDKQEPVVQS